MDANARLLGDPHASTRSPPALPFSVPYTVPVSCPLPQPTAAAPAVLHHVPHQLSTPYFTPNSLQSHTLGGQLTYHHQPSQYSAASYTVQPHVNPDIAGSLMQSPTQCFPPCSHDTSHRAECYTGSFTSSPIESSSGIIVKETDSGIRGNGSDCKWQYADNTGEQSKGSISRCTMTLDTDAQLIPPCNDTPCAITDGHKCLMNRWSLKRKCDTMSDEEREEQELDLTNSGVVTKYKAVAEIVNTVSQLVLPECKPKAKIVDLYEKAYSFNREQTGYMYKKVRKIERGLHPQLSFQ